MQPNTPQAEPRFVNGFKVPDYINWSATSWKRWRTCPKWFYNSNVIYTPVVFGRKATLAGSVVHEVNEEAFKKKEFNIQFYLSLIEEKFNEVVTKENIQFESEAERMEYYKKCTDGVNQFFTALRTHDLFDYEAVLESPFKIKFAWTVFLKSYDV